jgi:ethanolamine utilization protein EutN
MLLGRVTGVVWGTRRAEGLAGSKLLRVQPLTSGALGQIEVIAVDQLDAGPGDLVLVAIGSRVRDLTVGDTVPTKAVTVAIVDDFAVVREEASCCSE